jgi:hypothetical protein
MSLPGRGWGHSRGFVAADPDRVQNRGGRTFEHPSCGGFMPTAETTLIPASSIKSLTGNARLDNEPNFLEIGFATASLTVKCPLFSINTIDTGPRAASMDVRDLGSAS